MAISTVQSTAAMNVNALSTVANTAATVQATAAKTAFATSLRGVITNLAALASPTNLAIAGITVLIFAVQRLNAARDEGLARAEAAGEANKEQIKQTEGLIAARERQTRVDAYTAKDNGALNVVDRKIAELNAQGNATSDTLRKLGSVKFDKLNAEAKDVFEFIKNVIKEVDGSIQSFNSELEKSHKRILDIGNTDSTKRFEATFKAAVGYSEQQKIILDRVNVLTNQIARDMEDAFRIKTTIFIDQNGAKQEFTKTGVELREMLAREIAEGNGQSNVAIAIRQKLADIPFISPDAAEISRKGYQDLVTFLDRYVDSLSQAVSTQRKLIDDLQFNNAQKAFERSISGKSPAAQIKDMLDRADELKNKGIQFFNAEDFEKGRKAFDASERMLEDVRRKQEESRNKLNKAGVGGGGGPLPVDAKLNDLAKSREQFEQDALVKITNKKTELQTAQEKAVKNLIGFEQNYAAVQLKGLNAATEAKKLLNIEHDLETKRLQASNALLEKRNQLQQEQNRIADKFKQTELKREETIAQAKNDIEGLIKASKDFIEKPNAPGALGGLSTRRGIARDTGVDLAKEFQDAITRIKTANTPEEEKAAITFAKELVKQMINVGVLTVAGVNAIPKGINVDINRLDKDALTALRTAPSLEQFLLDVQNVQARQKGVLVNGPAGEQRAAIDNERLQAALKIVNEGKAQIDALSRLENARALIAQQDAVIKQAQAQQKAKNAEILNLENSPEFKNLQVSVQQLGQFATQFATSLQDMIRAMKEATGQLKNSPQAFAPTVQGFGGFAVASAGSDIGNTVNNINVVVNEAENPAITARDVVAAIRREARRGTISI